MRTSLIIFALLLILPTACTVSLVNVGIDYSKISSFSIEQFDSKAGNAPPTAGQQFSEQLKIKVLNNTRLNYEDEEGDIQFSGNVVGYRVESLAPTANQTVALQRLTIQVAINYKDITKKDGQADWSQTFSRFADFAADQDLASVETQLIQEIYDQVIEDVFNKAFSGW